MKKIKPFLLLILVVLTCFSLSTVHLKADSGWDSDYGSDWGSDYGSDYGSDWGSGYSYSSSGGFGGALFIFIVVVIIIIIASRNNANNQNNVSSIPPSLRITNPGIERETLDALGLDEATILNQAFEIYRNVQIAWMNFDYDTLRKYLSDELFNTYKMQLNALSLKKQKNIMEDIVNREMRITNAFENNGLITLTIELVAAQRDYVVDENDRVVNGIKERQMLVHYELTFTMTKETNSGKCPNCNAPLKNQASNRCEYCDSVVVTKNHDLIMTKKQNKGQGWN